MAQTAFPIGFWNIIEATRLGSKAVEDWADFGTTLTMTGVYTPDQDPAAFRKILDACQEKNIRVILQDRRLLFENVRGGDYEDNVRQIIRDFGDHPAVYGFHLGDEPSGEQTADAVEAVRIVRRLCPEKAAYLNLLPWYSDAYGGVEARVAIQADYKQYLIDFVRQSGIGILSCDCYFQLEELHGQLTARSLETYFKNLRIFQEAAAETGTEFWFTTLAVGHMMYRCPTQDDIRWELNTAVAHGAKSLFYWFLYSGCYNANYRAAPINELYERTETFRWISTENRIFHSVFGDLFCQLELEQAYHIGQSYGGYPLLEESDDPYIEGLLVENQTPMIVSRFRRPADREHRYYALVCNHQREPASVFVRFKKPAEVFEVRRGADGIQLSPLPVDEAKNAIHYWFSPGQMWVIAVKES